MAENQITPIKQISNLMNRDSVKAKFAEMLGNKAPQFISSVITVVNSNKLLQNSTPESIYGGAMMAATLDLPLNANFGFAYLVPFNSKSKDDKGKDIWVTEAQFQIGYKGFIQLAMRSGQYLKINVADIKEGQLEVINPITEEYKFNTPKSEKVVGYMAYFKLINGLEKYLYMSVEEIQKHSLAYSKTARLSNGLWSTNFDVMAKKTVLKHLLSKYGVLSIEIQKAKMFDQGVVRREEEEVQDIEAEEIVYIDNQPNQASEEDLSKMKDTQQKMEAMMKG